jgi:Diphosphoinositol pentakisphosphate kinase 2 N-terminal domain
MPHRASRSQSWQWYVPSQARSKPMENICKRLLAFGEFELVIFGDDIIVDTPVDDWPICDALLSWHSEGFPLKKVRCGAGHKPQLGRYGRGATMPREQPAPGAATCGTQDDMAAAVVVVGPASSGCPVSACASAVVDSSLMPVACGMQAQQYAALRKPYLINDILESNTLLDRRSVYRRLQVHIPHLDMCQQAA